MPKEKPQGVLDGIGKSFLGLPDSRVLNTDEKGVVAAVRGNELVRHQTTAITKQGDRAQESSQRAFSEIQGVRAATQAGAMALEGTRLELMAANGRLSRIGDALEGGLADISEELGDLNTTTKRAAGLPTTPSNIDELMGSGEVEESEIIILAMSGGLTDEQQQKVFSQLATWKRDIIDSGLVYSHDPKMEKTLSQPEKVFLSGLRRKASSGIMSFRSIEALAWHGLLEEKLQFNLSKMVRGARQGTTGVIHGIHELADQGETRIAQGEAIIRQGTESLDLQKRQLGQSETRIAQGSNMIRQGETRISQSEILNKLQAAHLLIGKASLEEQRGIRTGVDTLVDLGRLSQIDRHAIRTATEGTERNTAGIKQDTSLIARGVAAQVYLAQRAEQRLDRISGATEGTYRNTELLTVFAQRANEIAEANYSANAETAQNTAAIRDGVSHLAGINMANLELSEETAQNTGEMAANTRELVGFAARNEHANAIMIEQGGVKIRLLGDIADGVDTGNYYQALTREAIQEAHITLIQGFANIASIGIAQLGEDIKSNSLLAALVEIQGAHHAQIVNVLEKIEEGMERRHLSKNQARAQERFEEGLGNYRKGRIDDAIELFNKSMKRWGNDYKVYFYRGICYVLKDQPAKAEADLQEAFEWTEKDDTRVRAIIKMNLARLYYSESKVYLANGDAGLSDEKMLAAIITAQEASQEDPDFPETSFALATYLAAFKLYDEAREILMKIIPKDPTFAVKMLYVPEFAPILESFKHTLDEDIAESNRDTINRVSIAMIKDCIEIGEFSTAIACIKKLMRTGTIHLLRLKIWEVQELNPIRQQVIDIIMETIDSADSSDPQNCYALAMLALHFRTNSDEISDFKIFDAFLKGMKDDPDVRAKNKIAMQQKLRALSVTKADYLLAINKLHRKGLEWLSE